MVPLPDSIVEQLRDPTAALAAAFVIANHHPELLRWAAGAICPAPSLAKPRRPPKSNDHRRASRDEADKHLLEAMETDPSGSIGAWATAIGRSRTSAVSGLHRLRDAGLAESVEGKWRLVEPPREPSPRWVEPVSARRAHAHA